MKRKAETLIEIVVAMAVFGVMMSGICDFMAEQTRFAARTIDTDLILRMAPKIQDAYYKNGAWPDSPFKDGNDVVEFESPDETNNRLRG